MADITITDEQLDAAIATERKRLRWKMEPRETGLRSIFAGPRSSWLTDGVMQYACVSAHRGSTQHWYWVAGWGSSVPHRNTAAETPLSQEDAKAAAMAYVKQHLNALTTKD